jgi:multidrug resistance efflux pump
MLCAAFALPAEAGNLYRYRNAEGVVVVNWTVPAEYTRQGYEVLNDDGVVVEVVPRELTADERKDRALSQRVADQAKAEEERLRLWDESLLRRYSAVEDVEAARDRSLRELKIRISILKSNRRSLRQKVENYQASIADAERDGVAPNEIDLEAIEILKREIVGTEKAIDDRQTEVDRVFAEYALDIERLRQLQDVIALRRNLAAPGSD